MSSSTSDNSVPIPKQTQVHKLSLSLSLSVSVSSCEYLFQFRIIYFVHFLMLFYIIVVQLRYDPSEELFGLDVAPKPRFKMLS